MLTDQVAYLRSQPDQERQAHAEARRIIGGFVQRVPELEAYTTSEPREASENSDPTRATPTEASPGPQTSTQAQQRPFWRRIFGG
jgi:hypothetical protein